MNEIVAIVSSSDGFFTRGIKTKLEEKKITAVFVGTDIAQIDERKEQIALFVVCASDQLGFQRDSLVFLKDVAEDLDKKIIVIGNPEELEALNGALPNQIVLKTFTRPLDMESFLECVKHYFSSATGENRKKNILIVDDDITYMRLIYDWLCDKYHVGMASSGVQAIKYIAKNPVDLVLLDYEMPVANGPQVLEMLRDDSENGLIPVMFLTGKSDKESVLSVISLQPVEYLLKTIDREKLREKLDVFFASQKNV